MNRFRRFKSRKRRKIFLRLLHHSNIVTTRAFTRRGTYSVKAISSPVSFGRCVNTASMRSLASEVVRVSASLNSWPVSKTHMSAPTSQRGAGYGMGGGYRVSAVLHLLLLCHDGDDGLLWEVRGPFNVLRSTTREKGRENC